MLVLTCMHNRYMRLISANAAWKLAKRASYRLMEESGSKNTGKPLQKGTIFFTSGHVQNLMDTSSKDQYFLKAEVMSSFQPKTKYDVSVTMSAESSFVVEASCACRSLTMERCNHVCAVLFASLDWENKFGRDSISCTSKIIMFMECW